MDRHVSPREKGIADESPGGRTIAHVRQLLRQGSLRPAAKLPSENRLASQLGVSRGTVRLALQRLESEGLIRNLGRRGRIVSPGTRVEMSLMSQTVALLTCADAEPTDYAPSGTMLAVEAGLSERARASAYHVLMLNPAKLMSGGMRQLTVDRPRGIAVAHHVIESPEGVELIRTLRDAAIPIVVNGDGDDLQDFDRVVSDHERGAYDLTNWLLERGRRHIVRVWGAPPSFYWMKARNAGFERAMLEAGREPPPLVQITDLDTNGLGEEEAVEMRARQMAGHLVELFNSSDPPDSIMLTTDCDAAPAARACRLFGAEPGRDVLIAGYDGYWHEIGDAQRDSDAVAASMDKVNTEVGARMIEMLLARAEGTLGEEPQRVLMEPKLIEYARAKPIRR
jgi:DNA-binding LacI/PurR family transcriptional regulator/biotin operon repressor